MKIELNNVIPAPLAGISFNQKSVWGNNVSFSSENNYLVNAPSGTGKSTLVSVLFGTRNDFTGEVFIDGKSTKNISLRDWSQLRKNSIAVVFQDLRLFPELTALENILIKAKLAGSVSKEEILLNAEKFGIADRMNIRCRFLSLGQQQRVAILRALVQPFSFLLLDEPFSHLDEKNIELATALIMEACRKNNAGLLLTSLGGNHLFNYKQSLTI